MDNIDKLSTFKLKHVETCSYKFPWHLKLNDSLFFISPEFIKNHGEVCKIYTGKVNLMISLNITFWHGVSW